MLSTALSRVSAGRLFGPCRRHIELYTMSARLACPVRQPSSGMSWEAFVRDCLASGLQMDENRASKVVSSPADEG